MRECSYLASEDNSFIFFMLLYFLFFKLLFVFLMCFTLYFFHDVFILTLSLLIFIFAPILIISLDEFLFKNQMYYTCNSLNKPSLYSLIITMFDQALTSFVDTKQPWRNQALVIR